MAAAAVAPATFADKDTRKEDFSDQGKPYVVGVCKDKYVADLRPYVLKDPKRKAPVWKTLEAAQYTLTEIGKFQSSFSYDGKNIPPSISYDIWGWPPAMILPDIKQPASENAPFVVRRLYPIKKIGFAFLTVNVPNRGQSIFATPFLL
jgi:hypothetical protein